MGEREEGKGRREERGEGGDVEGEGKGRRG